MSPRRARAVGSSGCQVSYSSRRLSPLDRGLMVRPFRCRRTIAVRCKPAGHGVATCVAAKVRPSVQRCYVRSHDPTQHVDLRGFPPADPEASASSTRRSSAGSSRGGRRASSIASSPAGTSRPRSRPRRSATCTWASSTTANARPHPEPGGRRSAVDQHPGPHGTNVGARSGDDTTTASSTRPSARGTELWRRHYWAEFDGTTARSLDPWGNTFVLWSKAGRNPTEPEGSPMSDSSPAPSSTPARIQAGRRDAVDPHRPAVRPTSTRPSTGTPASHRSSCSTAARTPTARARGWAIPIRSTSRSSSCWSASSATRTRARSR